jgi:hypothetical protein
MAWWKELERSVPAMNLERESANLAHIDKANDRKSSIESDRASMLAHCHIRLV